MRFSPTSLKTALIAVALAALCSVLLLACSGGDEPESPTPTAAPVTPVPAPEPTVAAEPTPAPEPAATGVTVSISEGSIARYSVTEQLARLSSPIDAVGETGDVQGAIAFDADGNVDPERSVITVALAGLTSDEDRRDGYVRNNTLATSQFPSVELAVTAVEGLAWPFPDSGQTAFQLIGNMTVRDVTAPVEWDVEAQASEGVVTGQARTVITFDQFDLSKPSLAFIVSVEDEIRLELDIQAAIERQ